MYDYNNYSKRKSIEMKKIIFTLCAIGLTTMTTAKFSLVDKIAELEERSLIHKHRKYPTEVVVVEQPLLVVEEVKVKDVKGTQVDNAAALVSQFLVGFQAATMAPNAYLCLNATSAALDDLNATFTSYYAQQGAPNAENVFEMTHIISTSIADMAY